MVNVVNILEFIAFACALAYMVLARRKENRKALLLSDFVTYLDDFKVLDEQFAKIQKEIKVDLAFSGSTENKSLKSVQKNLRIFEKQLDKVKVKTELFSDLEVRNLSLGKIKLYDSFLTAMGRILSEKNMSEAYSEEVKLTLSKMANDIVDETEKMQAQVIAARHRES